jgi:hypothetical protein
MCFNLLVPSGPVQAYTRIALTLPSRFSNECKTAFSHQLGLFHHIMVHLAAGDMLPAEGWCYFTEGQGQDSELVTLLPVFGRGYNFFSVKKQCSANAAKCRAGVQEVVTGVLRIVHTDIGEQN